MAVALALVSFNGFANPEANIERYENARVAIKYKGSIGEFAQKLAAELNIPFYIAQANPTTEVNLKQDNSKNIRDLFTAINQQLKSENIRFDVLNEQLTLVLLSNDITELNKPNYIGDVVFDSEPVVEEREIVFAPEEKTQLEQPQITENKSAVVVDDNKGLTEQQQKEIEEQASKIESILKVSQDKDLIAQYSRRTQPNYVISDADKKAIKLNTVKSTKISTFLVFDDGVNLNDYQFDGQFQDFAKLANVAAILHRQQRPPQSIMITSPEGKQFQLLLK